MKDRHYEFMNKLTGLCREYNVMIHSNTVGDKIIVTFNTNNFSNEREVSYYFCDFIDANTKIKDKNK